MLSEYPSISVIVPLYNKANYVLRTLTSAFEQDSPADQVIVVDDGSTDGGAVIVESHFPAVTLIRQANSGEAAARNVGILHSTSEWVAFLDADDIWHPDHLRELRSLIATYPDAHMVATAYDMFPSRRRFRPKFSCLPRRRRVDILRMTRTNLGAFWTSALAVRRDSLERVGGFTFHGYGADVDTWLKIGVKYPCAYSSRPTATYFTGNPGVMQSQMVKAKEAEKCDPIITEISRFPGLAHVLAAASDPSSQITKKTARRYQNGRIAQALRVAVRNDLSRQITLLTTQFWWPIGPRAYFYLCLSKLPLSTRHKINKIWAHIRT